MANCPNCDIALQTVRQREGIYFHCNECDGRAVTIQQIRRTVGDRFISTVVRQVNHAAEVSTRPCPFCQVPMKSFLLPRPAIALDSCRSCGMIWFDAGKFEQLPEGTVETAEDVLFRGLESEAKWKIEQQAARDRGLSREAPEEWWKWIPAMVGFPVKYDTVAVSQRPWATWSLAAVITFISVIAFFDLKEAVANFGLIPAEMWRYGGATFVTNFFLHAGIMHLVGNMYFFLLFSGEVEEHLGHWRFLVLIFLSALVGNCFHILGNLHSEIPCIGASGGISGVLVFYALQFPKGKLAFFTWRFGWIQLPAWGAFVIWLILQLIGIGMQRAGLSHVSSMAHVGGVTTGFVLWLFWRKMGQKPVETEEVGY